MNSQTLVKANGKRLPSPQSNQRLARNNFDLIRFVLASMVCISHAYALSGFAQLAPVAKFLSSTVAVQAFFVVSGFLIFMSFEQSTSLASYAEKRIRRIYPAYFTIIVICAVFFLAISSKAPSEYFSSTWAKYVTANLLFLNFLQPTLPGVFGTNTMPAVNGALWTLKIEVLFYLCVPFLAFLMRRFRRFPVIALLYCASIVYAEIFSTLAERTGSGFYAELARQLPGQLSFFMAGAFLYYFMSLFERKFVHFVAAAALALIGNSIHPLPFLYPFALAVITIFFGTFLFMGNFGKFGDFSYGVYIIHFPIIQVMLYKNYLTNNPWLFLSAAMLLTVSLAAMMWHFVEKRFLPHRHHTGARLHTLKP